MFFTRYLTLYLIILFSILLHELGHVVLALLLGRKVHSITILPIGLSVSIEEGITGRCRSVLIYLAGPVINVLLAMSGLIIDSYYLHGSDSMRFFILMNIYLAAFNLTPVLPLDGGRILREVLAERVGFFLSASYTKKTSVILSFVLIALGIIQLSSNINNFSLILIGVYILITIKSEKMEAAIMNVKHVIYRRSRLLKKGFYPARDFVVIKSMHLGEAIKGMDFDRFHFIHVLDDDLKLLKVFTEQELVDSMLKYSSDLTFDELIKLQDNGI